MVPRPLDGEYFPYYGNYIGRVPQGADVLDVLSSQLGELQALVSDLSDAQANARPAPGEWSVKEVLGHLVDTERVFAYRMLRFSRDDKQALPGFEQDDYVAATDFNRRTMADLLDELIFQRRANVILIHSLTDEETARVGTASGNPMSARAAIYAMAGHVAHHVESLKTSYGLE